VRPLSWLNRLIRPDVYVRMIEILAWENVDLIVLGSSLSDDHLKSEGTAPKVRYDFGD
jgi:hypothetical protein